MRGIKQVLAFLRYIKLKKIQNCHVNSITTSGQGDMNNKIKTILLEIKEKITRVEKVVTWRDLLSANVISPQHEYKLPPDEHPLGLAQSARLCTLRS